MEPKAYKSSLIQTVPLSSPTPLCQILSAMTDPFQVISKIAYLFPRCIVFFSISPLE
jgi:hypothetical protein